MQTEVKNTQKHEYLVQILECFKISKKGTEPNIIKIYDIFACLITMS